MNSEAGEKNLDEQRQVEERQHMEARATGQVEISIRVTHYLYRFCSEAQLKGLIAPKK